MFICILKGVWTKNHMRLCLALALSYHPSPTICLVLVVQKQKVLKLKPNDIGAILERLVTQNGTKGIKKRNDLHNLRNATKHGLHPPFLPTKPAKLPFSRSPHVSISI
uniref:Putative secreted protein n=1 Tax=Anopheles darlingi TaxID=43151 RepID=A0A2M4DBZ7_ANODA